MILHFQFEFAAWRIGGYTFLVSIRYESDETRWDPLSAAERSERMSRIRSTDTGPEMVVRRIAHRMGLRYRLHRADLPGKPDLVFPRRKKVVFVHGCFWHLHGCKNYQLPRTRREFWMPKLEGNKKRDADNRRRLIEDGWEVLVIWECETRNEDEVRRLLGQFFGK